jgi:hypothetical protein
MPLDDECGNGRAGDAVRVEMISHVRELSSFTGHPDGVLLPPEEDFHLADVERPRAVLEHLWNTNVVDAWGQPP